MSRAWLGGCLVVLLACDKPAPPPVYKLRAPFAAPDGTAVVGDGTVAGTFAEQRARLELSGEATLEGARTMALRFPTACGHDERPFTLSGHSLEGRKTEGETGKRKPVRVALAMKPATWSPRRRCGWIPTSRGR